MEFGSLDPNLYYMFEDNKLSELRKSRFWQTKEFFSTFLDILMVNEDDNELTLPEFFSRLKERCDKLNYPLRNVIRAFEKLDGDCKGRINTGRLEDRRPIPTRESLMEESLLAFSHSSLIPGLVDVFDHSQKDPFDNLIEFAFRNRCDFEHLLPSGEKLMVEKSEVRVNIVGSLLKEFLGRVLKKADKFEEESNSSVIDKIVVKGDGQKRSELEKNDMTSVSYKWLLRVMRSISMMMMEQNPNFADEVLDHTKWALSMMDFFQLSRSSTSMSKGVVEEIRNLSYSFNKRKSCESSEVSLWFEFVCGNVEKILDIILLESLPVKSPLVEKLRNARNQIMNKESILLKDLTTISDGTILKDARPDQIKRYTANINAKCFHLMNHENDHYAIRRLEIVVGQTLVQKIKVFICVRDNFRIEDLKKEFTESGDGCYEKVGLQLMTIMVPKSTNSKLSYEFEHPIFGKRILIRFELDENLVVNVGVAFYGQSLPVSWAKFADKIEKEKIDDLALESLLFLSGVAASQGHKSKRNKVVKKFNFSTVSNAVVCEDTGLLKSCNPFDVATVSAQEPLSKEHPYFEIEICDVNYPNALVGVVGKGYDCSSSKLPGQESLSRAFSALNGGIYEESLHPSQYLEVVKSKERIRWKLDSGNKEMSIVLEKGNESIKRVCSENSSFYPAVSLYKGASVVLINKEAWRAKEKDEASCLNVDNITVDVFLGLIKKYKGNTLMLTCILHLTYHLLPFLSDDLPKKEVRDFVEFVSELVAGQEDEDVVEAFRMLLSRDAELFFGEEEIKSFDLTQEVGSKKSSRPLFEAFCRHVGRNKPELLLKLTDKIDEIEAERILSQMKKILSMTFDPDGSSANRFSLSLLSSHQTILFAWCSERIKESGKEAAVCSLVSSYLRIFFEVLVNELNVLMKMKDANLSAALKRDTLLSTSFRQLVVLLGHSCDWLTQTPRNNIVEILKVIYVPLKQLIARVCDERYGIFHDTPSSSPHWFHDVTASFSHLIGKLCGLSIQVIPDNDQLMRTLSGMSDDDLLTSDIWRLIFRAGLQSSGKQEFQRSLSGKHGAVVNSEALGFLLSLNEEDNEVAQHFIGRCMELANKKYLVGGRHVTSAVVTLFAALVWHTQPIRESLESHIISGFRDEIPENIIHAYKAAEILRVPMMKKRQDLIEEMEQNKGVDDATKSEIKEKVEKEEKEQKDDDDGDYGGGGGGDDDDDEKEEGREKEERVEEVFSEEKIETCENCPIADMRLKSEFLLQFAGLQKMQEAEKKQSKDTGTSVDRTQNMKQSDLISMYPSFQLVLNFVKDPLWNQAQIENLLDARRTQAVVLTRGYRQTREFLLALEFDDASSKIARCSAPSFFGGLLEGQAFFPKHPLDHVDGCGLMLETKVRQEFYCLVKMMASTSKRLVEVTKDLVFSRSLIDSASNEYRDCIISATLHLLHINWQAEDLNTILESDIIEFLLSILTRHVTAELKDDRSLEEELEMHSRDAAWIKEANSIGVDDFKYSDSCLPNNRLKIEKCFFICRHQLLFDRSYMCDYCRNSVGISKNADEKSYYRCIECHDTDICVKCVEKQSVLGKHLPSHNIVLLKYVCQGCEVAILGTRHVCEKCPSKQWCTGCVLNRNFKHDSHASDHVVTMERMPPISFQKLVKSSLAFYNQCHAALLLSNVALRSFMSISSQPITEAVSRKTDFDYQRTAERLYNACVKVVAKILATYGSDEEKTAMKRKGDINGERLFDLDDLLLGLLARLLPLQGMAVDLWKIWMEGEVIKLLLNIITITGQETNDKKLMALSVLKKIFQSSDSQSFSASKEFIFDGMLEFGYCCFVRGHLQYCNMISDIIRGLTDECWKECLLSKIGNKIINFNLESDKLCPIFYSLLLTGFSTPTSFGSLMEFLGVDDRKKKRGILLRCTTDNIIVVNSETRRIEQAAKNDIIETSHKISSSINLPLPFLSIIGSVMHQLDENSSDPELLTWFLSILIKAQSAIDIEIKDGKVSSIEFILSKVVRTFLRGQRLNRNLTCSDVENITLSLVTKNEGGVLEDDSTIVLTDPLTDIEDADLRLQFDMILQEENILNKYICRAIYDLYKDDRETLAEVLMSTANNPTLSSTVMEALEKVELKYKNKDTSKLEEDVDVNLDLFGLRIKTEAELLEMSGVVMEEGSLSPAKLMSWKSQKQKAKKEQRKEFAEEIKSTIDVLIGRAMHDEDYKKAMLRKAVDTLMAISCKQFLINFLLKMNFMDVLKVNLIRDDSSSASSEANEDVWISLIIYLLAKGCDDDKMKKLLKNILSTSTPPVLERIINMAHNFMMDVTLALPVDLRGAQKQGYVEVEGAESLLIQFSERQQDAGDLPMSDDLRCLLHISSSASFDSILHTIPVSSSMKIEIQVDKFHYKLDGNVAPVDKFYVVRKMRNKELFSAGLEVLRSVVHNQDLCGKINIGNTWIRLLRLFYEVTSPKRIKILSLILRISASDQKNGLDLSLLANAWNFYKKLAVNQGSKFDSTSDIDIEKPAIFLGLTDLFTSLAENTSFLQVISVM